MNFNLKQLEAFVWVADLGSFRKAADRLNTTQPNISARISALESALNQTLMQRDAGSVRLTSRGQVLLEHARGVLRAADQMAEAAGQNALIDGQLRLGVTEMIVHTWVREFLRVLRDRYPGITVELTVDLSANLEKELAEKSIDLAFQSGPFRLQTSGSMDLGVYPYIWIAAPETGLQELPDIPVETLLQYPILTHARGTVPFNEVSNHFSALPESRARLVPSSNLAACIHMTVDGLGVATVPEAMVTDELERGELVRINYGWTPNSLAFAARYDAERSATYVMHAAAIASEISHAYRLQLEDSGNSPLR